MRWPQASDLVTLLVAGLLLSSDPMSVMYGEEPAPPAASPVADPVLAIKIAGTVESLDDKVVEIVTTGDFEPKLGDVFEVFVTPPNGERGRVGRGKISFAKKGVVLGRLDEATGEIAAGLEVSIQSSKPQRRAAAAVTPAPAETAAAEPPVPVATAPTDSAPDDDAAPADAALAVSIEKLPGLFVGDDPRFPFVLQVTTRGEMTLVRGLGRMPYSADDPTLIMAEFAGISVEGDQTALRGVLTLHPDGERLTEPNLSPWVGLYDPASDDWQMMLSPKHVVGASRPGVAAKRGNKPAAATNDDKIDVDRVFTNIDTMITVSQMSPDVINSIARSIQMDADESRHAQARIAAARDPANLPPGAATTRARLGAHWNRALTALAGFGRRMSPSGAASVSGSGGSTNLPPPKDSYFGDLISIRGITNNIIHSRYDPQAGDALPRPRSTPAGTTPAAPPVAGAGTASSTPAIPGGKPATTPASGGSSTASNAATGVPPKPGNATDPLIGSSVVDWLAEQWVQGRPDDQISYTLVPVPDPALAWQIAQVIRDPRGRITGIVNYGGAPDGPDVAQGGAGTRPGGSAPAAPPNSTGASTGRTGAGSTGGTGTTPSGSGGTRNPDGTTRVVNADGSNRVPGSPPTKPPTGPGGVKPPQGAPAPPVPIAGDGQPGTKPFGQSFRDVDRPRLAPTGPTTTRVAGPVPDYTELVNEDSGRSPIALDPNARIPVPDLVGMTASQAVAALYRLGLAKQSIVLIDPRPDVARRGLVYEQEPAAGTRVPPRTVVTIKSYFDGGPLTPGNDTPDDIERIDQARAALNLASTAAQITAARAALNRAGARDPSGVKTQAKGPKAAGGDPHHDTPGSKPDDKKKHPLAGTWELTARVGGLQSATQTITVTGRTVQLRGSSSDIGGIAATYSGDGTLTDQGNGTSRADLTLTYNSVGAKPESITLEVSNDGSTMTTRSANGALTWRRTSPAPQPSKPGAGDPHHEAPGPKPDDQKKHPLAGTWKSNGVHTGANGKVVKGHSGQMVVTVDGRSLHFDYTFTSPDFVTTTHSSNAPYIDGPGKGIYALKGAGVPKDGEITMTLSADNATMTNVNAAGYSQTWQRVK